MITVFYRIKWLTLCKLLYGVPPPNGVLFPDEEPLIVPAGTVCLYNKEKSIKGIRLGDVLLKKDHRLLD